MKNLKEAFGLRLKEIRKNKNYTQETLAEMIDLSPRQLIRIENGENFPSVEVLGKLSLVLGISLDSLFDFQWNDDVMYFTNDIYKKPSMRIVKKGDDLIITPRDSSTKTNMINSIPLTSDTYETKLFELSKQRNKPLTVEFFENKKRTSIKTFYPDHKIEEVLSQKDVVNSDLYDYIVAKLKKNSSNTSRLNYIKTAVDSLDDKESLNRLSILIQGMNLT